MVRILSFVTLLLLCASTSLAADGVLMVVKGDVKVQKKDGSIVAAKVGQKVEPGDIVITGKESRAKVVMKDNNVLNISPEAKIAIEKYDFDPDKDKKNVSLNLLYGKVRSTVNQKYEGENSFKIKTPSAVAGVRGTDFSVGFQAPSAGAQPTTQVVTFEGKVEFGNVGKNGAISNPVMVGAGQTTSISGNSPPAAPSNVPKTELAKMDRETKADPKDSGPKPASTGGDSGKKGGGDSNKSGGGDSGKGGGDSKGGAPSTGGGASNNSSSSSGSSASTNSGGSGGSAPTTSASTGGGAAPESGGGNGGSGPAPASGGGPAAGGASTSGSGGSAPESGGGGSGPAPASVSGGAGPSGPAPAGGGGGVEMGGGPGGAGPGAPSGGAAPMEAPGGMGGGSAMGGGPAAGGGGGMGSMAPDLPTGPGGGMPMNPVGGGAGGPMILMPTLGQQPIVNVPVLQPGLIQNQKTNLRINVSY